MCSARITAYNRAAQSAKADFVIFQPRFQSPNTTAGRITITPSSRHIVHPFTTFTT
jgi:hypothetical protein